MIRKLALITLCMLSSTATHGRFILLRSAFSSGWKKCARVRSYHTVPESKALVPFRAPFYRRLGMYPYVTGLGIASSATWLYKSTQAAPPTEPKPKQEIVQPRIEPETPSLCMRFPPIEPEQSPAPLKGTFNIYAKGIIRCDAQDTVCSEFLKIAKTYGTHFGQCVHKDFTRTSNQPRTQECQSVFESVGIILPEPDQRGLPITGIRKAHWTSD